MRFVDQAILNDDGSLPIVESDMSIDEARQLALVLQQYVEFAETEGRRPLHSTAEEIAREAPPRR